MFRYYLYLAFRSLRRNVVLTALAVLAIGVGIGASMSMLTILGAATGDPIPQKSSQLFVPQIDNWGPQPGAPRSQDQLPPELTYVDATALVRAHAATLQAAMYPTSVAVSAPGVGALPHQDQALATDSGFFPMFDVPFEFGAPRNRADDATHAAVVVLTRALNEQLFGGADSVGRTLKVQGKLYRIIGVLDAWHPSPRFYDLGPNTYSGSDQLFLPFSRAIDEHMLTSGNFNCAATGPGKGWSSLLQSECIWVQVWVELPTVRDVSAYRTFLHNYAAAQRHNGRFNWPPHTALRDVMQWLAYAHVVPSSIHVLTYVSVAILLVCVLNAAGLMLAKFMARASEVGVRRALGATRAAVFAQCLVEAAVLGSVGGLVGIGVTELGLLSCRSAFADDLSALATLRIEDVVTALVIAIAATLLAGFYPTWRASQVEPAAQIRTH